MRSKDPSTQAGSVIVRPDETLASVGYNGFPQKMPDAPELYLNREEKYSRIIHAELNALLFARERVTGYTCYIWPLCPCDRCAVALIQAGITTFVYPKPSADLLTRWQSSLARTQQYFRECGVTGIEVPT